MGELEHERVATSPHTDNGRDVTSPGDLVTALEQIVLGHPHECRLAVAGFLARAHILIEDAPGTGKTLLARSLASMIGGSHRRVQATPDLLPSDITGTSIYRPSDSSWEFRAGPVFTNVLLVDEVNRASPRTQAALLEPMEEHQVTVDGSSRPLPTPFLVVATQNPLGDAGTFPLPTSQLDRFGVVFDLGRPARQAEQAILSGIGGVGALAAGTIVASPATFAAWQDDVDRQHVAAAVTRYVLDIADALRSDVDVTAGPSTRALLGLQQLARAWSLLAGRNHVTPSDIRDVAPAALAHRVAFGRATKLTEARQRLADVVLSVGVEGPG